MNVADAVNYSSVLLLNLSDSNRKQSQFNTVFVQQEKMDRVGFEPTTSASYQHVLSIFASNRLCMNKNSSNPILSII
jgi:hypothetical protein